jgi:hypothetical protein
MTRLTRHEWRKASRQLVLAHLIKASEIGIRLLYLEVRKANVLNSASNLFLPLVCTETENDAPNPVGAAVTAYTVDTNRPDI